MTTQALPGPMRRFALADLMFPSGIEGVAGRLTYLLLAFPLFAFVVISIAFAAPAYLVFALLGSHGASAWLLLLVVGGALLVSCAWFASSFIVGVTWVLDARSVTDHDDAQ